MTATQLTAAAPAPDVHAVAQAVDERYNHLRTLQTDFTEITGGREWNVLNGEHFG